MSTVNNYVLSMNFSFVSYGPGLTAGFISTFGYRCNIKTKPQDWDNV